MGWEDRNGRSYYYRKERDGARVRNIYIGCGEDSTRQECRTVEHDTLHQIPLPINFYASADMQQVPHQPEHPRLR